MIKIQFDRMSFDGSSISKKGLESWFDEKNILSEEIKKKMAKIHHPDPRNDALLREIEDNIHDILLLSPDKLEEWADKIDNDYPNVFTQQTKNGKKTKSTILGAQVLKAFHYDHYRKNRLVELAKMLNVKSCPYCNMHYTLYAEEGGKKTEPLAKLQFDHFYSKTKYPMLSMSLYNLIPSCAICNQGKFEKKLSLLFHPYYSYISKIPEQFKFELGNPIGLHCGERIKDVVEINIVPATTNQAALNDFIDTFHIKALYQRHGDIAQETFDKAYEYPYYSDPNNFKWLSKRTSNYIKRLWMGTYTEKNEIEKRPMTKFIQDLWEQALRIKMANTK